MDAGERRGLSGATIALIVVGVLCVLGFGGCVVVGGLFYAINKVDDAAHTTTPPAPPPPAPHPSLSRRDHAPRLRPAVHSAIRTSSSHRFSSGLDQRAILGQEGLR